MKWLTHLLLSCSIKATIYCITCCKLFVLIDSYTMFNISFSRIFLRDSSSRAGGRSRYFYWPPRGIKLAKETSLPDNSDVIPTSEYCLRQYSLEYLSWQDTNKRSLSIRVYIELIFICAYEKPILLPILHYINLCADRMYIIMSQSPVYYDFNTIPSYNVYYNSAINIHNSQCDALLVIDNLYLYTKTRITINLEDVLPKELVTTKLI